MTEPSIYDLLTPVSITNRETGRIVKLLPPNPENDYTVTMMVNGRATFTFKVVQDEDGKEKFRTEDGRFITPRQLSDMAVNLAAGTLRGQNDAA